MKFGEVIRSTGPFLLVCMVITLSAQPVRVMTYNIRLDVASDGENAWPVRKEYLSGQIRFYDPDVFGIQEGLPHQVGFLQQQFPEYDSRGMGREGGGKGESTHIFFRKSRFRLLETHTFWLSETPDTVSMGWDAACLRVCTAVLLSDKKSGRACWIFNAHLDHMGERARENGVALILDKIKTFNRQSVPVILMGDMNSTPDSPVIARLKAELTDTEGISQTGHFGPDGTFNGFRFQEPVTHLIDYIFASKSIGVLRHAFLSDSRNLRYPSDHLPVLADLIFEK